MVGMIEHIDGVGLSGMAEKTGKQAKNSLFGKLLAMLEQHAQVTGKAQLSHAGKSSLSHVLSDKGDPLVAAKSKLLPVLAIKGKQGVKAKEDDRLTPLFAAHVVADVATQGKKTLQTGKAIFAGEQTQMKGERANKAGKLSMPSGGAGVPVLIGQTILSDAKPTGLRSPLVAESDSAKLASARLAADAVQVPGEAQKNTAKVQGSVSETAARIDIPASAQALTSIETSVIKRQVATGVSGQKTIAVESGIENIANTTDKVQASLQPKAGLQVNVNVQSRADLQSKVDLQSHAESSKALLAAHVQQNKTGQLPQGQGGVASPVITSAGMAASGMADASLADSGSQPSDKGNQDGRYISASGSDAKSGSSATSVSSNFHQYLSGKTAPSMTLFDSVNHIAQSASKGKTKLEIQLEPANLGKIQISLQSDAAKQLQVHIIVDQSATRAALEQQLPQLRSALAQQGFDLSGFSMGSQGQQNSTGNTHQGRQGDQTHQFANPSEDLIPPSTANVRRAAGDAGLSIRV